MLFRIESGSDPKTSQPLEIENGEVLYSTNVHLFHNIHSLKMEQQQITTILYQKNNHLFECSELYIILTCFFCFFSLLVSTLCAFKLQ